MSNDETDPFADPFADPSEYETHESFTQKPATEPTNPYNPYADLPDQERRKDSATYCESVGDYFVPIDPLVTPGIDKAIWCYKPEDYFGKPQLRWFRSEAIFHGSKEKPLETRVWRRTL